MQEGQGEGAPARGENGGEGEPRGAPAGARGDPGWAQDLGDELWGDGDGDATGERVQEEQERELFQGGVEEQKGGRDRERRGEKGNCRNRNK